MQLASTAPSVDAHANQDAGSGHILQRTPSNPLLPAGIISLIIMCIGIIFR